MPMTEDELITGLATYVSNYIDGEPDPDVMIRVLGTLVAYTLATLVRSSQFLPDQIDVFLAEFCATLRQLTCTIIREEDAQADA
jgi:hypothetical protein